LAQDWIATNGKDEWPGHQTRRTLTLLIITVYHDWGVMIEHYKTLHPKPKNTEESLTVNKKLAAAGLKQHSHTELRKKTSSLCERWDGYLERALRQNVS